MAAVEDILSELEAVTGQMARAASLDSLGDLCSRRGELIRELGGRQDVDIAALERAKAILRLGCQAEATLSVMRESLRHDLRDLERSIHLARQWGATIPATRKGMVIDA